MQLHLVSLDSPKQIQTLPYVGYVNYSSSLGWVLVRNFDPEAGCG